MKKVKKGNEENNIMWYWIIASIVIAGIVAYLITRKGGK